MERISSKVITVLAISLLCIATVAIAKSQEKQNVVDVNALAAKGEEIANQDPDPLVAELRNQQPEDSRRGFYIGIAIAEGQTLPGPGKDRICASLSAAEQRACSSAVLFSVDRNRNADLAARGAAIAKTDPFVARARTIMTAGRVSDRPNSPDVFYTLGFDIGIGAAEGDTLPGPGKQKIHDALNPRSQTAFATAVTFSLDRNRYADLAAIGFAIAQADPVVAKARTPGPTILRWLGFDIATGLFGDPALGAAGNTAMGPGSKKIRDSLSPAGQVGFDDSVALHLSRNYKR